MDQLSLIKRPIEHEFSEFSELFSEALTYQDGLLSNALDFIRKQSGKSMRPIMILLLAKAFGKVTKVTQHAAVALELLHTASLVHDDVVDESLERRGQDSVNAIYKNKVAVLVGDFILSTTLLHVSFTEHPQILNMIAKLGRTLSAGEILQLSNISNQVISEKPYYQVIKQKTAALFATCAAIALLSAGASAAEIQKAQAFGETVGIIFQIRDDIFDYYDSKEIGKPTGNDMLEGKLTLPAIYALNKAPYEPMLNLAKKVKAGTINNDEIAVLVEFTKQQGGIEYAIEAMKKYREVAQRYIDENIRKSEISSSLTAYLDYVVNRTK